MPRAATCPYHASDALDRRTRPGCIASGGALIRTRWLWSSDPVTLDDSTNPVTVHPFGNPHAEDYVLVDAAGALWVVDIFSPQTGAPFPRSLADFVNGAGLEIFQVVGGHGGVASLEELTAG